MRVEKLPYDQTLKTGNAFIYEHNDTQYIVSTAHIIIDSFRSVDSEFASKILCNKVELVNYSYSRFFDVVVFEIPDGLNTDDLIGFKKESIASKIPKSVNCRFIDTNSDNVVSVTNNYFNIVHSHVEMGAIAHKLIGGSSGSAVTSNGELVGMISSCGEMYDNMTLCIQQIQSII